MTYRIVRMYLHGEKREIIKRDLTLEGAQEHCEDPETSSFTCESKEGLARTTEFGPWFDGYEKES